MHTETKTAFAVVKIDGSGALSKGRRMEAELMHMSGIRRVHVDPERRVIHLLYDGEPQTVHRLGMLLSEIGHDVLTRIRSQTLGTTVSPGAATRA